MNPKKSADEYVSPHAKTKGVVTRADRKVAKAVFHRWMPHGRGKNLVKMGAVAASS